ncbi:amphi-Trp domain-containing protein [Desulfovibrio sp. JC010]|uniref:amphi-Trp domain-containing protein n=1 Tax=Desulfovibrio sp. JC010 TaxID=2593641 RepID=UPI0013D3E209|nr:amphi-Trp domain-containing protein [Desulfovibrio sp. JC010]NDV28614.1 amphi-Trp domain-containing protein [Desulfovibrio sp. JC010]
MASEKKFVFESLQDADTIRTFLQSLVDGFESGTINLSTNGDNIELQPEGLLNFTVKAKRKAGSNKINIKIGWKDSSAEADTNNKTLNIDT